MRQVARLLHSLATCSPIVPTFSVGHFVSVNCTVELLIRIPPLSYALMEGASSDWFQKL